MKSTRRDFMKAAAAATTGAIAGCSSGGNEEEDDAADLYEIIDGINYDQRSELEDINATAGEPVYEPDTLNMETDPEDILESSGDIDYTTTVRTHEEGPFRDMSGFPEDYCCDGTPLAAGLTEMVVQNIWRPLKNSEGGSFGNVEAGEEFRDRLGSISAKIEDHAGNTAEVTMSQSTAEEYWEEIEHLYEEDREGLDDLSREMNTWTEENMETSF